LNNITTSDGVLAGATVLYGISPGFFDSSDIRINVPPFTNATKYKVAAGSTTGPWWGTGLIVRINFTVVAVGRSDLTLTFTDLTDQFANEVNHDHFNGVFDNRPAPPPSFSLNVNVSGNGTVTKNPDTATYLSGTSVSLTAIPAVNWTFQGWSGDLSGSQTPVNITMNGNKTVTATFVAVQPGQQFTLTVNVVGSGSVTENPSNATYMSGAVVTLTASPAVNWTFHLWSGDLTGALNPINITMDANKTVTATFAKSGDFNDDGKINLQDLTKLASWYMMNSTSPLWTEAAPPWGAPSEADFDHDGKINLVDLVTLAVYYSTSPH
jgi:uncharacterized repeat protein (TIGR02543 family)